MTKLRFGSDLSNRDQFLGDASQRSNRPEQLIQPNSVPRTHRYLFVDARHPVPRRSKPGTLKKRASLIVVNLRRGQVVEVSLDEDLGKPGRRNVVGPGKTGSKQEGDAVTNSLTRGVPMP